MKRLLEKTFAKVLQQLAVQVLLRAADWAKPTWINEKDALLPSLLNFA